MNAEETEATRLYELLKQGKKEDFLKALEAGQDINGFYFEKEGTFLNKAASNADLQVVDILLEEGANPNTLFNGNNTLEFVGFSNKKDTDILRKLIDAGAWILPFFPSKRTIIDSLEIHEAATEEELTNLDYDIRAQEDYNDWANYMNNRSARSRNYDPYNRGGMRKQKGGMTLQEEYAYKQEQLDTIREQITILRPIAEQNTRKLKIGFAGTEREEEFLFDIRAPVSILSIHIYNFFMDNTVPSNYELIIPSFHMKNKRVMEKDRAVSDYGVRDGTKIVVTPILQSQRHGGKKTMRQRKIHKKRSHKTRKY